MKPMKSAASATALSVALGLALVAAHVRADEPATQAASPQQKAIEAWTATLAVQAATTPRRSSPCTTFGTRSRSATSRRRGPAKSGGWKTSPRRSSPPSSGYVSPNVDVLYGFGFADLGAEPVILTAPDSGGRYYMVEVVDMYSNAFAYPAGGTSGYKGAIRLPLLVRHRPRAADPP